MYDLLCRVVETGYVTFDEVLDLSPREMGCLIRGRQAAEERAVDRDRLFFGSLISTYLNAHTGKNGRRFKWDEIFGKAQNREQSEDEIERKLDAFARLFGDEE